MKRRLVVLLLAAASMTAEPRPLRTIGVLARPGVYNSELVAP